jgi:hypothetical protein
MLKKLLPLTILILLLAACSQNPELEDAVSNRFQVGDEWTYLTRPGEGLSSFVVTKIDRATIEGEETLIIHIAVTDLAIEHPEGGQVTTIPHIPITEEALNRSALQGFNTIDPIPQEYLDTYQNWLGRFEAGDATVFQTSIATTLDSIEISLQSP